MGKFGQKLIRFTAKYDIAIQFAKSRGGRRRRVWADCDFDSTAFQSPEPLLRNAQFWRRASPKEIRRRSWNDEKIGVNLRNPLLDFIEIELIRVGINQKRFISGRLDLVESKKQLERIVRFLATEVNGTVEIPRRIN